jgi:hypothetical protein
VIATSSQAHRKSNIFLFPEKHIGRKPNIPKIDLVEVFVDLLEAENLKSKDLADEYTAFVPAE